MQPAPSSLGVCFRLAWPSVLLAGFLLGTANVASAQQPTVIWTYDKVGTAAELPNITPRSTLSLRPNVTQAAYLYVRAGSQGGGPYTASLIWVNPEGGKQEVATAAVPALKANEIKIITGWKLAGAGAPAPAPAPAAVAPAAAANIVPGIELAGLAPVFQIQLTPTKPGATALPPQPFQIGLERPADYLSIEGTQTSPSDNVNRVEITVTARAGFHGPACPVRLDLSTLPGLNKAAIRGVLTGKVAKPGDKATLLADVGFIARATRRGAVGVTADDWTQAELFGVDFSEATNRPTLVPVKEPRLEVRLPVPLCNTPSGLMFCSKPVETLPAHLEVYTPASRAGSVAAWFEYQGKVGEKIAREGTREQHIHLLPPKPDGALLFKTVLRDWILNVPTPGTAGQTQLIAQLNTTEDGRGQAPIEIRSDVLFDDTPPADINLTAVLPTEPIAGRRVPFLVRGQPLVLRATALDDSGIANAVFFLGKLPDDNKPPKDAVPGKLVTEKGKTFWQATLPISPKAVGPLDVGVVMVDNVGLSSKEETVILLKEPVPPDTTIEGDIFVGDLLQPKLGVELRDDKGVVKASTTTDANGHYKFTKVLPGAYHVTATKVDGAHGDHAVEVLAGQQKTGVDLSLLR